ncbi:hypothetical protein RZ56_00370 [Apilactobacillus kunkeei]|nr:hypothetical protein RZ56_00370 [Apilactobacillus kunkeei]
MENIDLYTLSCAPQGCQEQLENVTNMKVKSVERETIKGLLKHLKKSNGHFRTDGIVFDFKIEGVDREFDILKNTREFLLSIELKSSQTRDKIINQLKKQRFYLSKIDKRLYQYIYDMSKDKIFYFDGEDLLDADVNKLIEQLNTDADNTVKLKEMFSPERYLTSPFNDTQKFLDSDYILTASQIDKKKKIMSSENNVFLKGGHGTGKTLLAYDIAKTYLRDNKKILIIHGANLNDGQEILNKHSYNIKPISYIKNLLEDGPDLYNLVILDEVQRFTINQVLAVLDYFKCKIILSGDPKQILRDVEFGKEVNSDQKFDDFCNKNNLLSVRLSEKIRTNRSLLEVVRGLMDKNYDFDGNKIDEDNVSFTYFDSCDDAKNYMEMLERDSEYKVLTLPGSLFKPQSNIDDLYKKQFSGFDNCFQIIGQEYTSVATLLGPNMYYDEHGKVSCHKWETYYDTGFAFFQNITRTRKKIKFIIYKNEELLSRIMELIDKKSR